MGTLRSTVAAMAGTAVLVGVALAGLAGAGKLPGLTDAWDDAVHLARAVAYVDGGRGDARAPDAGPVVQHKQSGALSKEQLGAPLVHETFVSGCGAPDDMKVTVSVTVTMGRAAKVTAKTAPPDPAVAACVERAVGELKWDISPKTDHLTVTY
jgi:hypothetical protein